MHAIFILSELLVALVCSGDGSHVLQFSFATCKTFLTMLPIMPVTILRESGTLVPLFCFYNNNYNSSGKQQKLFFCLF